MGLPLLVYLVLFLLLRFIGKKLVSELSPFDLVALGLLKRSMSIFSPCENPRQGMRGPLVKWVTRETKSRTRKMKNKIFAIPADAPAIPPNPKAAATRATIKNTKAQYSMGASPFPSGK